MICESLTWQANSKSFHVIVIDFPFGDAHDDDDDDDLVVAADVAQ